MNKDFATNSEQATSELLKELARKYPEKIEGGRIGRLIGWGGEGFVYSYGRGRVLKINLNLYQYTRWREAKREIEETLRAIEKANNESIARVYGWGFCLQERIWYVEMERLVGLSKIEEGAFKKYAHFYKDKDTRRIRKKRPRKEGERRMKELLIGLEGFPTKHQDFLPFNVMKERKSGRWKAVDLESFEPFSV